MSGMRRGLWMSPDSRYDAMDCFRICNACEHGQNLLLVMGKFSQIASALYRGTGKALFFVFYTNIRNVAVSIYFIGNIIQRPVHIGNIIDMTVKIRVSPCCDKFSARQRRGLFSGHLYMKKSLLGTRGGRHRDSVKKSHHQVEQVCGYGC